MKKIIIMEQCELNVIKSIVHDAISDANRLNDSHFKFEIIDRLEELEKFIMEHEEE